MQIKRTKPKAECVNGSVRALFGKLGHACLSEKKQFPCKAALRPLSLPRALISSQRCWVSLPLSPLRDVSYVLRSFLRFKNLGWSGALEIHWFSNSAKTLCPWGKNALSWGLREGTKCKSVGFILGRCYSMCPNMSIVSTLGLVQNSAIIYSPFHLFTVFPKPIWLSFLSWNIKGEMLNFTGHSFSMHLQWMGDLNLEKCLKST